MTNYRVIVEGRSFDHQFDGEPQINLTFKHDDTVYKVITRAHDEDGGEKGVLLHARAV